MSTSEPRWPDAFGYRKSESRSDSAGMPEPDRDGSLYLIASAALNRDLARYIARIMDEANGNSTTEYTTTIDEAKRVLGESMVKLGEVLQGLERERSVVAEGEALQQRAPSPYHGASPFYRKNIIGAEVKYSLGVRTALGMVWYPQFVGNIRTISPSRAANAVTITALDRVEKLRRPVIMPNWTIADWDKTNNAVANKQLPGHWVIDNCLRWGETSTTPWRPNYREETNSNPGSFDGPQFFWTGTAGFMPTLGWPTRAEQMKIGPDSVQAWERLGPRPLDADASAPRPWAPRPVNAWNDSSWGFANYWSANAKSIRPDKIHYLGFTLNRVGSAGTALASAGDHWPLAVNTGDGLRAVIRVEGTQNRWTFSIVDNKPDSPTAGQIVLHTEWLPLPPGTEPVDIFVVWNNHRDKGGTVAMRGGSNANTPDGSLKRYATTGIFRDHNDFTMGQVEISTHLSISDATYANRGYEPEGIVFAKHEAVRPAKYKAYLDDSLVKFSFLPNMDGKDAWDILTEVAASEYGSVFWDERGDFRFWNFQTIRAKAAIPVRTITPHEAGELTITSSLDSVRNVWSVTSQRQRIEYDPELVVRKGSLFVGGGQTLSFPVDKPDTAIPTVDSKLVRMNVGTEGVGYSTFFWYEDHWQDSPTFVNGLDVWMTRNELDQLTWHVRNGYGRADALVQYVRFDGYKIADDGTSLAVVRDNDSVKAYGNRNYRISGPWVQEPFLTTGLVQALKDRSSVPVPTTDAISIAGDPRLQLGDALRLADPDGVGEEMFLQIYGYRRTFTRDGGLEDVLTVEMTSPPGIGRWDSDQYGRWDSTLTWS